MLVIKWKSSCWPDAAGKDINHKFLREQTTGKRKDLHAIVAEHACFTQSQIWKAQKNCKRLAKCTKSRCRNVLNVGTECNVIKGALMVTFNTNKAVAQKLCYCLLDAFCITNRPPWTKIRPFFELTFDNDINDDRKKEIFSLLNISRNYYSDLSFCYLFWAMLNCFRYKFPYALKYVLNMGRYFPVEIISANLSFIFLFFYSRLFNILVNDCDFCHLIKNHSSLFFLKYCLIKYFGFFYAFHCFKTVIIFMGLR